MHIEFYNEIKKIILKFKPDDDSHAYRTVNIFKLK